MRLCELAVLAICLECLVKSDLSVWHVAVERQSEEYFLRNSLADKIRYILKPELPVVIRMSNKAAFSRVHIFKPRQPILYQSFSDPLPLEFRLGIDRRSIQLS